MDHYEIAVVGAGLAGSLAALALSATGRSVALVAPASAGPDRRTTALMDEAVGFIGQWGMDADITAIGAPLRTLRIVDGTDRLVRAPVVTFRAAEIALDAFGYNVPNAPFLDLMARRIADVPSITRMDAQLLGLDETATQTTLHLDGGPPITASLVIGADGRRSKVREAARIEARSWTYPQTAVVTNVSHERPHENISTEFHTQDGPFTQVPLPGDRSSLVWVMKPEAATEALALDPSAMSAAIERRMRSILGKVAAEPGAQAFQLSGMTAARFGRARTILIGEAAHAFPPIGAQGLNLSLRDVMDLVRLLGDGREPSADTGDRYDGRRRADIMSRTASVDLLNRSLLTGFLPVQLLRAGGLQALSAAAPLRGLMMREGLRPGSAVRSVLADLRDRIGRASA